MDAQTTRDEESWPCIVVAALDNTVLSTLRRVMTRKLLPRVLRGSDARTTATALCYNRLCRVGNLYDVLSRGTADDARRCKSYLQLAGQEASLPDLRAR